MKKFHNLLERQIKKYFGSKKRLSKDLYDFLFLVDEAYRQFDEDRYILEHVLELNSQDLLDANSEMNAIFNVLPDFLIRINRKGEILDLKSGIKNINPIFSKDLIGKNIDKIKIPKLIKKSIKDTIEETLNKKAFIRTEYKIKKENSSDYFEVRSTPFAKNEIIAIIRNINGLKEKEEELKSHKEKLEKAVNEKTKDLVESNKSLRKEIRERINTQKELIESKEKYKTLIKNLPIGIYRASPGQEGKLLMVNPALYKMFKFESEKEVIDMKVSELYSNPKQRGEFSKKLMKKSKVQGEELKLKKKDGTPIWVSVTSRLSKDENGNLFFDGTIEDITEKKLASENLKKSYEKLKEIDKMKDSFIAIASHELRTPMTLIKGYSSILLEDYKKCSCEEVEEQIKNIYLSSEKILNMIDNMLDISKIESGIFHDLEINKIDIKKFISNLEKLFLPLLKGESIELEINLPQKKMPMALINEDKLKQVFNNLIENATKYSKENKNIKISAKENKGFIEINVLDNGIGIDKKYHKIIFDKFTTAENHLKKGKGAGLGLSICKQIIEQNGGKIWVESEKGKGANFLFTIPIYKDKKN